MLNPITEMKAELTTAKVLQTELHHTLKKKRESIQSFYQAKEKAESEIPPKPQKVGIEPPTQPKYRVIADQEKEQALLKMAKAEYQSYADVAKFAEVLNLRAGVVYLTLKHHGFIKQNETTQYRVLDSYYKNNGNLRAITEDTGLTVWICSQTIKQLGLSPNWQSYRQSIGIGGNGIGGAGENEFARLVPFAVDMNQDYQANNPIFDFVVNEKTIDVKTGALRINASTRESGNYVFRLSNERPDFYCFFVIQNEEKGCIAGNYRILLIPAEVIPEGKTAVYISHAPEEDVKSSLYWDFEVEPAALATMLEHI
ncbi:riboflavin synthase subunit alpha [Mannheimia sp. HC-2023]|uniref:riboflavin synthase subunit alpha n=1 Tax=Mannheimia indoligenes TaxID=3103145 RepID=UPI002FE59C0C